MLDDIKTLAMICLTGVFVFAILIYGLYMLNALKKVQEVTTPHDNTFRFGFLAVIMVVLAYLAFGLGTELNEGILALIGTLAGYVLGRSKDEDHCKYKLRPENITAEDHRTT